MRPCETCGAELVRHPKHSEKQWREKRFCNRQCSAARLMKDRACACGCDGRPLLGRKYVKGHRQPTLTPDGYRRIWRPGHPLASKHGHVLEHRAVVYDAGIPIPDGYHVHHRNGVKHDNRLENLEVVAPDEHARRHAHAAGQITNQFGTFPLRSETVCAGGLR